MFCTNCGKQIIDTARFCNYCGMSVASDKAVDTQYAEQAVVSTQQNAAIGTENDSSVPVESVAEQSVPFSQELPQMVESPKSGEIPSAVYSMPTLGVDMQSAAAKAPSKPHNTAKEEGSPRMYTIGHIIMCLISTAVMAIAAGVFAGLYFSVV